MRKGGQNEKTLAAILTAAITLSAVPAFALDATVTSNPVEIGEETTTEETTEAATEAPTEAPTEKATEAATQAVTEALTQAATQAQPVTEKPA